MKLPFILVLLAAMLWGTTGTAQAFAPAEAHPLAIGAVRLAVGGSVLLLLVLVTGSFSGYSLPPRTTILAAISMACYQPFFFSAVLQTGIAIGTVVAIGSAPVLAGLLEWLFYRAKQTKKWWFATSVSVAGCLLLFTSGEAVSADPGGILLALGAGLSFAMYSLVNKQLLRTVPPLPAAAVVFTLSACFLLPLLFWYDLSWLLTGRGVIVSLHLGVAATSLAYFFFSTGLQYIPSSTAVTLSLAEPLTAALLGVLLVGEELLLSSWFGIGLILSGLIWLAGSRGTIKNRQAER